MKHKKHRLKKPIDDFDDDEDGEEEEFNLKPMNQLQVADIGISSRNSLKSCRIELKKVLQDKIFKNYLNSYNKKKLLGGVSYIG